MNHGRGQVHITGKSLCTKSVTDLAVLSSETKIILVFIYIPFYRAGQGVTSCGIFGAVEGLKFLLGDKKNENCVHTCSNLRLDFIAINNCFWVNGVIEVRKCS